MSLFDLRQAIESAVPWWAPYAIPIAALAAGYVIHLFARKCK